jgi:Predicted secreted protein (DUF2259)
MSSDRDGRRPWVLHLRGVGALFLLATLVAGASSAAAGEASARRVIGFSPDGAQFAMEEYGASDPGSGKGDIHSFISIVDTATNEILDDSVNATMDAGGSDLLAELRRLSAQGAAETLAFHKIGAQGRLIGADPSSRPGDMFSYAKVWPVEKAAKDVLDIAAPEIGGKAQLALDYDKPKRTDAGEPSSEQSPSFVLTLLKPDGKRIALTKAIADPHAGDRGAFYKYAIAEVWLFQRKGQTPVIAPIVETFTQGSEGADRHFIPVAIALPTM